VSTITEKLKLYTLIGVGGVVGFLLALLVNGNNQQLRIVPSAIVVFIGAFVLYAGFDLFRDWLGRRG
jgi:uncharacterized membrane protein